MNVKYFFLPFFFLTFLFYPLVSFSQCSGAVPEAGSISSLTIESLGFSLITGLIPEDGISDFISIEQDVLPVATNVKYVISRRPFFGTLNNLEIIAIFDDLSTLETTNLDSVIPPSVPPSNTFFVVVVAYESISGLSVGEDLLDLTGCFDTSIVFPSTSGNTKFQAFSSSGDSIIVELAPLAPGQADSVFRVCSNDGVVENDIMLSVGGTGLGLIPGAEAFFAITENTGKLSGDPVGEAIKRIVPTVPGSGISSSTISFEGLAAGEAYKIVYVEYDPTTFALDAFDTDNKLNEVLSLGFGLRSNVFISVSTTSCKATLLDDQDRSSLVLCANDGVLNAPINFQQNNVIPGTNLNGYDNFGYFLTEDTPESNIIRFTIRDTITNNNNPENDFRQFEDDIVSGESYRVYYMEYNEGTLSEPLAPGVSLTGITDDENPILLSSPATIFANDCEALEIAFTGGGDTVSSCVSDSVNENYDVTITNAGTSSGLPDSFWVLTDENAGTVRAISSSSPPNVESLTGGTFATPEKYEIYYVEYDASQMIDPSNVLQVNGADFSNLFGSPLLNQGFIIRSNPLTVNAVQGAAECTMLSSTDFESDLGLTIYPNPVMDNLNLSYNNQLGEDINIEVLNMLGQSIMKQVISDSGVNENSINISNLDSGTYFLVISNDFGDKFIRKVLKN